MSTVMSPPAQEQIHIFFLTETRREIAATGTFHQIYYFAFNQIVSNQGKIALHICQMANIILKTKLTTTSSKDKMKSHLPFIIRLK